MATLKRTDFILNSNGDFPLEDNVVDGMYFDTPIGPSDTQHIKDIIFYGKGALKQFPTLGFNVRQYINSEYNLQNLMKNLKIEMDSDGYNVATGAISPANKKGFYINDKYISRR